MSASVGVIPRSRSVVSPLQSETNPVRMLAADEIRQAPQPIHFLPPLR